MFIIYYIWGFIFFILSNFNSFLEKNFFIKNNPFFLKKRVFRYISYLEKLFLVLFYKKGWFENSISNLYRKKDIIDYRKNYYPIINSFHIIFNKTDYKFNAIHILIKQYNFYKNNKNFLKLKFILNSCFKYDKNCFINFIKFYYIFVENYFNLINYFYFYNSNNKNLLKMGRVFLLFTLKSKNKLNLFNLDRWFDWYYYNFNVSNSSILILSKKIQKKKKFDKPTKFKNYKINKWVDIVLKYKKLLYNFNSFFKNKNNILILFRFNYKNFFKINFNNKFLKLLKYYTIKFSESSVTKYINNNSLKNYSFQFLRKNRIFNKGRYSRNRQLYRTGVYWCLWLNIIMVYGLYFIFYRFSFNFGYFWWGILILAYSTIFSRISKYNFYNLVYIYKEFYNLILWYGNIFKNFFIFLENFINNYFFNFNIINYLLNYKKTNFFFSNYYTYLIKNLKKYQKNKKKIKMLFIWQGMKEKDNSLFKYKTVLHWIKEIYRLIIT